MSYNLPLEQVGADGHINLGQEKNRAESTVFNLTALFVMKNMPVLHNLQY